MVFSYFALQCLNVFSDNISGSIKLFLLCLIEMQMDEIAYAVSTQDSWYTEVNILLTVLPIQIRGHR